MKAIIQRVKSSSCTIDGKLQAKIDHGITVLIGYCKGDDPIVNEWLSEKLLGLRIFPDEDGKMNKSIIDVNGSLLLIPNFTLCAQTQKGLRPSFIDAEDPSKAKLLFDDLGKVISNKYSHVSMGVFGADMLIDIANDGPVTLMYEK